MGFEAAEILLLIPCDARPRADGPKAQAHSLAPGVMDCSLARPDPDMITLIRDQT